MIEPKFLLLCCTHTLVLASGQFLMVAGYQECVLHCWGHWSQPWSHSEKIAMMAQKEIKNLTKDLKITLKCCYIVNTVRSLINSLVVFTSSTGDHGLQGALILRKNKECHLCLNCITMEHAWKKKTQTSYLFGLK